MAPTSTAPGQTGYDLASSSYFILNNLPQGAEFGLDTQLWTVAKFSGVKFLPPGLHLLIFAASPRTNAARTEAVGAAGSLGVRHGLLRFFNPGETMVETYSELEEGLESDALRHRKRTAPSAPTRIETVTSIEYLKSLDTSLAAYPTDLLQSWPPLVNYITNHTIARVIGLDGQGSGRVDALMSSVADDEEIAKGKDGEQMKQWGKERAEEHLDRVPKIIELEEGEDEQAGDPINDEDELLAFVTVDLKRSWPAKAQGEELSRWSQDKSWLLSKTIVDLGGDPLQLLAELQLSFILFALLHNFSSLSTYKTLISLFSRSPSLLLPLSLRPANPPSPHPPLLALPSLPLFASFLSALLAQLAFLAPDFFAVQMPGLEDDLLEHLRHLRQALRDADGAWEGEPAGDPGKGVWREVVGRWEEVRVMSMEKWGWDLGEVRRGTRVLAEVERAETKGAGRGSKWDDSSDEDEEQAAAEGGAQEEEGQYIDIEDLEEGEDAPVIVEM